MGSCFCTCPEENTAYVWGSVIDVREDDTRCLNSSQLILKVLLNRL